MQVGTATSDNGVVNRRLVVTVLTVLVGLAISGCSQAPLTLPSSISGHSTATVADVKCEKGGGGVVTVSGVLTGRARTRPSVGVGVSASVYGSNGRLLGQVLWPPAILRKGQSKPFLMPVGTLLIEGRSSATGTPPVLRPPTCFPAPVRCSVNLRDYAVLNAPPG